MKIMIYLYKVIFSTQEIVQNDQHSSKTLTRMVLNKWVPKIISCTPPPPNPAQENGTAIFFFLPKPDFKNFAFYSKETKINYNSNKEVNRQWQLKTKVDSPGKKEENQGQVCAPV